MQAGPRHHIGFRTEDIAHPFLDIDQFDEAETRIVRIEEKIDLSCLASRRATEMNEYSRATPAR
jgi:hypothetical protein